MAWILDRGNRRPRYCGTVTNDRWFHVRAAAINLRTLVGLGLTHDGTTWCLPPIA